MSTTVSVLSLETELRILARRVRRAVAERAAALDPTLGEVGFAVADQLHQTGGQRQRDLVAVLAVEKAAVSRAIAQLVDLGLAAREPDPEDGRGHLVDLTSEGRERMTRLLGERRAQFAARLADWTPEELGAFAAMLGRYNAAIAG